MKKAEKKYRESQEFNIFCNYGCLAAEKRNVYTYGAQHQTATCSDRITVKLPANDHFNIFETVSGEFAVETSWGLNYDLNDILQGSDNPCIYAVDREGKGHRVQLVKVE